MTAAQNKSAYLTVDIEAFGKLYKWCNWSGIVPGRKSIPIIELRRASPLTGTLKDETIELIVPTADTEGLVDLLAEPGTVVEAPITLSEVEVNDADEVLETVVVFGGTIESVTRNYQGRRGQAMLRCSSTKNRTDAKMGLPCGPDCPWRVYDGNCQVVKAPFIYNLTLVSFNPETLQAVITGGPSTPENLFTRGTIERDGLVVDIKFWSTASPGLFYVQRTIPSSWIGQPVVVTAGCDNTKTDCLVKFNNLQNNGGIGDKMLDYDPNFETGGVA